MAQAKALSLKSQFIFVCFLNGKKQKPKEKTSKKLFVLFKLQLLLLVILTQSILAKKIFFGAEIQDIYCVRQRTSSGEPSLFIAILGDAPA